VVIRKIGIRTCFQFFLLITRLLKGHSFIMDAKHHASRNDSKAFGNHPPYFALLCEYFATFAVNAEPETAKFAKTDAKLRKAWFKCLILAGLVLFFVSLPARAQQPAKPIQAPNSRPRTANAPSKTSTTTPANPSTPSPSISSSSNDPQQLLAAGQAAQAQGRFEEAVRIYNRVIALSANQPRTAALAHFRIGNAYMAQGKFGNAQVAFERAVALNPTDAESYNNLGEALGELKQYPRAIENFNRALALDPKLLKAKYNQAVSYDRMGNFRYSEFVFRSLIKSSPNYSLAYDGLAVTLSKAGRAKEAITFHEKAIALDPREPSYYFNCAISYLMMGNTAKALEQQEKLKAIDPAIADRLASVIVKRQM
jgi:Flp pilus assembly protein TadD